MAGGDYTVARKLFGSLEGKKHGGGAGGVYCFGQRNVFRLDLQDSREGFFSEREGKDIPRRGAEDGNGTNRT